jgi:hypothetical protein
MSSVNDLRGVWKPETMAVPDTQVYDVLTFHADGTGFLDFSSRESGYFCEHSRWSLHAPGELRFRGARVHRYKSNGMDVVDSPSTLNADVSFSVRTEHTKSGRQTQILQLRTCPWFTVANSASVATERYLVSDAVYATFRAACFVLAEEADDRVFRGKALSVFLAEQLTARQIPVGEIQRVLMGACFCRGIEVGGQTLGLSINWDLENGGCD